MLDYDKEADVYDARRGGEPRAAAAADAVLRLIPDDAPRRRLLDLACGTGIVTRRLAAALPATRVTGSDLAAGMTRTAAGRLPGAVVRADSRQLPFATGSFDIVVSVWLLHLLPEPTDVRAVVAECARLLGPGGVCVTTVDKAAAHDVGSDIDAVLAPRPRRAARDAAEAVESYAAEAGLVPEGRARFTGRGQGRSPRSAARDLRGGWFTLMPPGHPLIEPLAAELATLPDQDRHRPDPVFTLRSFRKGPAVG